MLEHYILRGPSSMWEVKYSSVDGMQTHPMLPEQQKCTFVDRAASDMSAHQATLAIITSHRTMIS